MNKILRFMVPIILACVCLGMVISLASESSRAAAAPSGIEGSLLVTTLVDEVVADGNCSLREAIQAANTNLSLTECGKGDVMTDTITFNTSGTITLKSEVEVNNAGLLVIDGASVITVSGGDSTRVFRVNSGAELALEGLAIMDGYMVNDNGGGILNEGTLTVTNSTLSGNRVLRSSNGGFAYGGSILNNGILFISDSAISNNSVRVVADGACSGAGIYNTGTLIITNSTISNNHTIGSDIIGAYSSAEGGGISNSGSLTITNSTLSSNSVSGSLTSVGYGGGIFNNDFGTLTITNSTFSSNTASDGAGGGIYNFYKLTITKSTFSGNSAMAGGGIYNRGAMDITHSNFSGNSVPNDGGGIENAGTLTITNSTLSNNSAPRGGGITNYGTLTITNSTLSNNSRGGGITNLGTLTITNSTLTGNSTGWNGGGIYNGFGSMLTIANTSLSGNSAGDYGGGIYNNATLTITTSTLSGNSAGNRAGGIYNEGTLTMTNTTISANDALEYGGGISNKGSLEITNSTLSGNSTYIGGGGIYNSGMLSINNSIVASSTSGGDCLYLAAFPISDNGHNISSDDTCGFDPANGSMPNTDPLLGPLHDNGGPTWTHTLLTGSPAIDAGDNAQCPGTDQRSEPRPVDGNKDGVATCDIGSFEYQGIFSQRFYLPIIRK